MTDDVLESEITGDAKGSLPENELARALFAVLQAEDGVTAAANKEDFQSAWTSERRRMHGLARKITRRLERRGFSVQPN